MRRIRGPTSVTATTASRYTDAAGNCVTARSSQTAEQVILAVGWACSRRGRGSGRRRLMKGSHGEVRGTVRPSRLPPGVSRLDDARLGHLDPRHHLHWVEGIDYLDRP